MRKPRMKDEGGRMKGQRTHGNRSRHPERTREGSCLKSKARFLAGTLGMTVVVCCCLVVTTAFSQVNVPFEKLRNCTDDSANWLTHNGNYSGHRYSKLTELTPANVGNLKPIWVFQSREAGKWECTPLVVDGVLYITE